MPETLATIGADAAGRDHALRFIETRRRRPRLTRPWDLSDLVTHARTSGRKMPLLLRGALFSVVKFVFRGQVPTRCCGRCWKKA